ncbi:LysR substrate-binding domain-containing protein [Terrarubrum flagellatum]|uniref:LysR substrate-binding domain-containing protein n=1 Tax=Terrirubrum flagellatum TaxID=2895980 RepID=UPI003144F5BB
MNLRDIDIFHAIMTAGGAGSAAELLGISQPAVSRSLAHLERELGFKLFDRVKGRLVPTREGLLFHADVRASFVGLDRLKQRAAQIREVGAGTLNVASLSALGHGLVPRAIAAFALRHPNVRVGYEVRTSNVVRDLVASGRADIGLAADQIDTGGVLHTVFATPRAVCVMPARHRLASREIVRPVDLANEPLIALSPEDTVRQAMDRLLAEHRITPQIAVETPYGVTIAILASLGMGVGLVNPLAIADRATRGIVTRPFEPALHFRALLLRPPDGVNSNIVDDFVKALFAARNSLGRPAK